jgi:wyosine [tRNA(Phe)-imidazoG37] synthetase (radical SAM superfamily)
MSAQLMLGPGTQAQARLLPEKSTKIINAFSCPRDFLENRFVYLTLSSRARGLSIGVNVNPDRKCNFDCVYCEVDRSNPPLEDHFDPAIAAGELQGALRLVHDGNLQKLPPYSNLPADLLKLRHVALSGDGEPTISPNFLEAVEMVVHIRALGVYPFFKIVLITNGSELTRPEVKSGLKLLTARDEIWAKLDAASQRVMDAINRSEVPLETILANILATAKQRPVIIQSLFCQIGGVVPSIAEIDEYALRLRELKESGAQIPLVQVYSATRPSWHPEVRHLPLKTLSDIAATVRRIAGLKAEPF